MDADVFVNARRFHGRMGFTKSVEQIVAFHFFYGYNSGQSSEVEEWATEIYRGHDLFELFYNRDQEIVLLF